MASRFGGLALLALISSSLIAAPALAAENLQIVDKPDTPPKGFIQTREAVEQTARQTEAVQGQLLEHPRMSPTTYTTENQRWHVSWFNKRDKEVAQVIVDDASGRAVEQWTGPQVAWKMARGYPGAFGRSINVPWVWLPLCLLFLVPFIDIRNPRRLLHFDLLVLLSFTISHTFFDAANIAASVPLVYPVLLYLLARMLWEGWRRRERATRLIPHLRLWVVVAATVLLIVGRIVLNVLDGNVIDVGYAGVIGAERIAAGEGIYGEGFHEEVGNGDTYGPLTYLTYVPFELLFPWGGEWDGLPAAHGAAIAFDLLALAGLFVLGTRFARGPPGRELGVALAFAWVAYPYSSFSLMSNANDTLVAAALIWTMALVASPVGRGAMLGLAAAAKFAPLILAPVLLRGPDGGRRRFLGRAASPVLFVAGLAIVVGLLFVPFVPDDGFREIFERTIAYQADRNSPFSVWGSYDIADWLHRAAQVAAAALAVALAVFPRKRDATQIVALSAAVLLALQLTVDHWFYLYVVWFAPLVFVALFARHQLRPAPQ